MRQEVRFFVSFRFWISLACMCGNGSRWHACITTDPVCTRMRERIPLARVCGNASCWRACAETDLVGMRVWERILLARVQERQAAGLFLTAYNSSCTCAFSLFRFHRTCMRTRLPAYLYRSAIQSRVSVFLAVKPFPLCLIFATNH